jgi:hypothetical protein
MAGGFKRGGFQGGGSGGFKKGYAKKRSPEDDDDAPRASKKSKGDDDKEEESAPVVPKLQIDHDNNPFVAVRSSVPTQIKRLTRLDQSQRQTTGYNQRLQGHHTSQYPRVLDK